MDDTDARKRLAAAVPANVREVCATLTAAGFQAVTVGGAVRDALLGRTPGDWDVASSARPEDVQAAFRHTIPTGIQHGTVTIVTGRGVTSHVEVTTFRGEGAYTDARRPDHVVFGVPLVEDLARRDLVVNAIAYDPAKDEIIDPFGGRGDLERKVLRAVGTAVDRFTEDGLRVMRAVRFASQLEFALDPETEAGIGPALPSLSRVSRERVCDELRKLLGAYRPSLGLVIAKRTGILANIFPSDIVDRLAITEVDKTSRSILVRLATLFARVHDLGRVETVLRGLKFSNAEVELAAAIASVFVDVQAAPDPPAVRRLLSTIGRANADALRQVMPAFGVVDATNDADPIVVKDLAVTGGELIKTLQLAPGPQVGRLLEKLLSYVLEDPTRNTPDELIRKAKELAV